MALMAINAVKADGVKREWFALSFSGDIKTECERNHSVFGCFRHKDNKIVINEDTIGFPITQDTIGHEIGHYYMKATTKEEYVKVFGNPEKTIEELREIAADKFRNWWYERGMYVQVSKPYVRYGEYPDVYEYSTGRYIGFEEAMEKNIWSEIQDLPFTRHLVTPKEAEFFEQITIQ